MATNNAINLKSQGIAYYNGSGTISGIDGSTSSFVLTSNGTGAAPSFQASSSGTPTAFSAYVGTTLSDVIGNNAIYSVIFNSTTRNDGTCYNTATGVFTAPSTGLYSFNTALFLRSDSSFTAGSELLVSSLGSVQTQIVVLFGAAASAQVNAAIIVAGAWMVQMTTGDTMQVQAFSNSTLQDVSIVGSAISPNTFTSMSTFSGVKVA